MQTVTTTNLPSPTLQAIQVPENETPPKELSVDSGSEQNCALAEEVESWKLRDVLLAALVVLATFYTIYFARAILFPVTLAVLLNLVFKPIVLRLQRLRVPAVVSATLVLFAFASAVGAGLYLLWEPASNHIQDIRSPGYLERLAKNLKPIQQPLKDLEDAGKKVEEMTSTPGESTPVRVQIEQPQLGSMLNVTGGVLGSAVIMFVLLFFLLAAGDRFLEKLVELMPTFRDKRRVVELSREVQHRISDYLFTITAINVALGAAIGTGMWLIGLPNPILWGVSAALLNYIPFAGPAIGAIIVFVVALGAFNSLAHAALAPAIYVGLNALEANFITPAMLGKSISLNPVMIVLAIVFWGWLWGIGGVLLSVPLLVVLKICFDHSRTLTPLGSFMER